MAVICFSYLWHSETGLTAAIKSSKETHISEAPTHHCLYSEPKFLSRVSVYHLCTHLYMHLDRAFCPSQDSQQGVFIWRGFVEEQLFALTLEPKGAAVQGLMAVLMRRQVSVDPCHCMALRLCVSAEFLSKGDELSGHAGRIHYLSRKRLSTRVL